MDWQGWVVPIMAMIMDHAKEAEMEKAKWDDMMEAHFFGMWSVVGKEVARKILRQVESNKMSSSMYHTSPFM